MDMLGAEHLLVHDFLRYVWEAPTIDPVRHGRWINESEEDECHNVECECSLCHHKDIHAVSAIVPYCWHCGAKMDGGSDDEQQG